MEMSAVAAAGGDMAKKRGRRAKHFGESCSSLARVLTFFAILFGDTMTTDFLMDARSAPVESQ